MGQGNLTRLGILPSSHQGHIRGGALPICNISLKAEKPSLLPLPNENDKSLGAELKRQRLALEWTQEATAKYFGVLKDSCQKWEWNQIVPHIRNRKKVVDLLGFNYWDDGTNSLANNVLLFRIENGLIKSELAKKIRVSTTTIERIENSNDNVSKKMKDYINSKLLYS